MGGIRQQGVLLRFGNINGKGHGLAAQLLAQFRSVYFIDIFGTVVMLIHRGDTSNG